MTSKRASGTPPQKRPVDSAHAVRHVLLVVHAVRQSGIRTDAPLLIEEDENAIKYCHALSEENIRYYLIALSCRKILGLKSLRSKAR
jgi:hypothetical protein